MKNKAAILLALLFPLFLSATASSQTAVLQAAINATPSGGTLYLSNVTYALTSTVNISQSITIVGSGYRSFITGDPGNHPLIAVNGASNVHFRGVRFQNTHVASAGEVEYSNIWFNAASNSDVFNCWFTGGRTATNIGGGSHITVSHNVMIGLTDVAVASHSSASYLTVSNNYISGSVTSLDHGPPHDINLEDANDSIVSNNLILESTTGFTQALSSGIQISTNHTASLSNDSVTGNVLRHASGGTANVGIIVGGAVGTSLYNVTISNNAISKFATGIEYGDSIPNGVTIQGNHIDNFLATGIYATSSANANGAVVYAPSFTISGNEIVGPGSLGTGSGVRVILWSNVGIQDNQVSNSGKCGISLEGVDSSTISGNIVHDNGQSHPAIYGGISLGSSMSNIVSSNNSVRNNTTFDDENSPRQWYGIYIMPGAAGNNLVGNQGWGNIAGAIGNFGTGTVISP